MRRRRPRTVPVDTAIVLDYSGSMNNESDLWNCEGYLDNGQSAPNNPNQTSNNQETVYPLFGHYSNAQNYSNYANYANLLSPVADGSNPLTGNPLIGKCNNSISALGVPAMVNDYWSNNRGATAGSAFTPVPDSSLDSFNQADGDKYLWKNGSTTDFASTLADALGGTTLNPTFESQGYKAIPPGNTFKGYIQGPRYWGKTFFIWPPDPKTGNDWRNNFFGTKNNTQLWNSSGVWNQPSGNYTINYKNILAWIQKSPNAAEPQPRRITVRTPNAPRFAVIDVIPSAVHPAIMAQFEQAADSVQR